MPLVVHPAVLAIGLLGFSAALAIWTSANVPTWWAGGVPRTIAAAGIAALSWTAGGFATQWRERSARERAAARTTPRARDEEGAR